MPDAKQTVLMQAASLLKDIRGVQAVVLGGSYARGAAKDESDLDIGIYYAEDDPFAIADIRRAAVTLSGDATQEVTDFYGWGAWVNGGGWIHTTACKIDFLYRNLNQVERTIHAAQRGEMQHDFDQQPAYGFYSVIYLAETNICIPLYDPQGAINRLKGLVRDYPPLLKQKTTAGMLWQAEFSLLHAQGYAATGNAYTTVGALTRTAANLVQALFALNETYFMSDKAVAGDMAHFRHLPPSFLERLTAILGRTGETPEQLQASVCAMHGLWLEVVNLMDGTYRPAFRL